MDKPADKTNEKLADKFADKVADKVADRITDDVTDKLHDQAPRIEAVPVPPEPKGGMISGAMKWAYRHPKTSLLLGAGVTLAAGAEVLAAGLFGGAVAAVIGIGRKRDS